jgi:two-component system, NtrC family, sensor histidine kinase KinB
MLRTRLFLNLLPFVVILLATGVYAIVLFSRLAAGVDTAVSEHYRSVLAAQQMSLALAGIDREAWAATATQTNESTRALAKHRRHFEENLALQLKNHSLAGESDLNQRLAAKYQALCQALAALSSPGTAAGKHRQYERDIAPTLLELKVLLDRILGLNQQAILATRENVQKITRDVTRLMVIGMAIALIISAYACYQLSRSVLQPILSVTKATRELGEGNLKQPVPVLSRDELGELARAFNKMAAQLQEYRQSTTEELVRLHRTMETTLASFPDPIFVLNKEGRIELMNPAATEMAAALQTNGQLPSRLQAIAQKTLASGEHFLPHSFDAVLSYRLNGTERAFLPRILTMRNKEDTLFGVAVVLYDVTRFRLLDAAKTHLVGTVSHELKTPLTSVRMVLHILLEKTVGTLSPKQEELLEAARTDTERLLRILNDLLDLARLEEGATELHREKVAPAELFQAVMEDAADKATAKQLKINCSVDPDLPQVWVDRQRIGYVFANLLTNAIKHSPAGGEIRLRATRAEDQAVQFTVADDGPGIEPQYQQRIFDRFFRVPGQTRSGAGLGLSIAREIAIAHGGRISVRSAPGKGATFYLELKAIDGEAC